MKRLLAGLIVLLILFGSAEALPKWGPNQGFYNPGNIEVGGTLSVGGVDIVAGSISYTDVKNEAYTNETAINASISALTTAAYTNETAINSSISSLTTAAYTNETAINSTVAALTTAAYTNETAINSSVAALTTAAYTNETAINSSISSLTTAAYTNETAINSSIAGLTTAAYTNETAINSSVAALTTATYTNETAINSSISSLTTAAYTNETAINASIGALVVPFASFSYNANSVDQGVFTASGGWVLTAVKMTPRVPGADGSAVTVMVKICDSGEAPASGDNMLSGTLDLKGTADTVQSGTVSAGTIATGKIVALDFTGTLTDAVGVITLYGTRA